MLILDVRVIAYRFTCTDILYLLLPYCILSHVLDAVKCFFFSVSYLIKQSKKNIINFTCVFLPFSIQMQLMKNNPKTTQLTMH